MRPQKNEIKLYLLKNDRCIVSESRRVIKKNKNQVIIVLNTNELVLF